MLALPGSTWCQPGQAASFSIHMKKILFLDFDGVLHFDGGALFSRLGLLEKHLLQMPGVEIVISSSWREEQSIEELKNYFPTTIRDQIVDVTPTLGDGYDRGGRQREIQAYLDSAGLDNKNCSWIALDDVQIFFEENWPHLILTDSNQGFTEIHGSSLLEWYRT